MNFRSQEHILTVNYTLLTVLISKSRYHLILSIRLSTTYRTRFFSVFHHNTRSIAHKTVILVLLLITRFPGPSLHSFFPNFPYTRCGWSLFLLLLSSIFDVDRLSFPGVVLFVDDFCYVKRLENNFLFTLLFFSVVTWYSAPHTALWIGMNI